MANFAMNLIQATNWDPQAEGPPIHPERLAPRALPAPPRLALASTALATMPVGGDIASLRYKYYPFHHKAVVIGQPAISPTAAVGSNSWDWKFGIVGSPVAPITKANQNLPIAPVPTEGM